MYLNLVYNPVKQVCFTGEKVLVLLPFKQRSCFSTAGLRVRWKVKSSGAPGVNGTRGRVYLRAVFFALLFILTGL